MKFISFISTLLLLSACVPPKQPPLDILETHFIQKNERKYNCRIKRGIDVSLLTRNPVEKGSYHLNLVFPCDSLYEFHKDSSLLESRALSLAQELYNDVIKEKKKFNKIWLGFSCDTSDSRFKDFIVVYNVDSLFGKKIVNSYKIVSAK